MSIVYLSASGALGGAERSLLDLIASLRAAQPDWSLALVSGADGPLLAEAEALGVAVHRLPFPAALARAGEAGGGAATARRLAAALPTLAGYRRRLRRMLRVLAPDAVHANGFKMHALGALSLPAGAFLVWHMHDYASSRAVMRRVTRALAPRAAAALAVSESVAEDARGVFGTRLTVRTVPNAVDLARFTPHGPALDLDALAGLPPAPAGTVRVGLVATMGIWKGHDVFLDALAAMPRETAARVRGYVVGGPVYQTRASEVSVDALRARAAALRLPQPVGFTGFVADSAAAMRGLDVVVHASTLPEPFGLVIAEGMACGRATIATAAGGAAELVRDGVDALAVPPRSVARLAAAIARLADDAGLRARLGAAARETAERRYDRARLAAQVAPLYRALAGEDG